MFSRVMATLTMALPAGVVLFPATATSYAQTRSQSEEAVREGPATDSGSDTSTRPEAGPLPPGLVDDFEFPDPDQPWGRPRYLDPGRHQPRYDDGRYDGYRRYYDDAYTYRHGVPYERDGYAYDLERAYRQGVADGQDYERFEIQAERGLSAYRQAMVDGDRAFALGDYGTAARQFLLAAALNQGDPAARLCAAHTQIALRNYEAAARLLRRAFELQPRIAYLPIDVRKAYGKPDDFGKHLAALHEAAASGPKAADLHFLLGYYCYFSGNVSGAAESLAAAAKLAPRDPIIRQLNDVARLTALRGIQSRPAPATRRHERDL